MYFNLNIKSPNGQNLVELDLITDHNYICSAVFCYILTCFLFFAWMTNFYYKKYQILFTSVFVWYMPPTKPPAWMAAILLMCWHGWGYPRTETVCRGSRPRDMNALTLKSITISIWYLKFSLFNWQLWKYPDGIAGSSSHVFLHVGHVSSEQDDQVLSLWSAWAVREQKWACGSEALKTIWRL